MVSSSFQCIKQICHSLIIKRIRRIVIILFLQGQKVVQKQIFNTCTFVQLAGEGGNLSFPSFYEKQERCLNRVTI